MKWLQKKQNAVKANNTTNKLAMAVSDTINPTTKTSDNIISILNTILIPCTLK